VRRAASVGQGAFALQFALLVASAAFAQIQAHKWIEVRSPHFLVVTDGSERQGRQLAGRFEAIRSVFEETLGLKVESGKPFVVMGFKDEKSMRAVMPEFWKEKGRAHPVGWFQPAEDKVYAVIRLDAGEDGPYATVYHEFTHMVLDLNVRSLPLWMEEGLAQFYGFSTINGSEVGLGRPDANCIMRLRAAKRIPLDELFRVTHDSPYYTDADKAPTFYAQSWALTHYLMLAEKPAAGEHNRLSRFLALLSQGVGRDEATRRIFPDTGKLQAELTRYIERTTFPYLPVKTKANGGTDEYAARVLSPAETAARLGDFELHDHRPQDAKPLLEEALRLDPGLAVAEESLGLMFMRQGDRAEALKRFDRAIAGDSRNFLAHYYHALLTLGEGGSTEEGGPAETDLLAALRLNPQFVPAYIALAKLYLAVDGKTERALELVRRAVDLEPGDFSNQMMLLSVLVRLGRNETALGLAKAMEQGARSENEKKRVRSFIDSLNPAHGKTDQGPGSKQGGDAATVRDEEPVGYAPGHSVFYTWTVLGKPLATSDDTILPAGSGDALFSSAPYDAVWAATLKALAEDYKILNSDKKTGRILAETGDISSTGTPFRSLSIRVQQRGMDVGVNVKVGAKEELSPEAKKSLLASLFEDIAVLLSVGG
jgi:tetratricopeptide (TPR) repeat protein